MKQPLIALDQLANTLLGGMADETLSARAFRLELQGKGNELRELIDAIFFWQERHCYQAWRSEIERRQLPGMYAAEKQSARMGA